MPAIWLEAATRDAESLGHVLSRVQEMGVRLSGPLDIVQMARKPEPFRGMSVLL
jgi:hypothetical protein